VGHATPINAITHVLLLISTGNSTARRAGLDALTSFAGSSPAIRMGENWRAGRDSRASFAGLRSQAKLGREPPILRFEEESQPGEDQ